MLDQRRRRWADVVQMLYKDFVFTGKAAMFPSGDGNPASEKAWLMSSTSYFSSLSSNILILKKLTPPPPKTCRYNILCSSRSMVV